MNDGHVPDPSFVPVPTPPRRQVRPFKLPCCGDLHSGDLEGLLRYVEDHMRNCSVFRNDVTARTCPATLGTNVHVGDDNTTHHLLPYRVGTMRGEPVFEHRCVTCGTKAVHLKSDSAIEAAIALIIDHVKTGSR